MTDEHDGKIRSLQDLYRAIGRIEGKMDLLCETIKNHEDRLNDNEKAIANAQGKSTVIGAVMGFMGGLVIMIISIFLRNK